VDHWRRIRKSVDWQREVMKSIMVDMVGKDVEGFGWREYVNWTVEGE
jgi:hypothetical protein